MNRIISFSEVSDTLEIVPPLGTPNRCAYVKVATENNGTSIPNSPINRLIWHVEKNITYYTVTWVFNDGVTPDKVETNVPQGTSVDSATAGKPATDPTRTGYDFAGWYIGNDLLDDQTVSGNTTVTAHWTPVTPSTYTVTWNPNNGQWPDNTTTSRQRQVNAGTLISSLSQDVPNYNNVQPGWQFDKWTYSDGTDIPAGATVDNDITLLAHYTLINYTVTLRMDDNSTLYTGDSTRYPNGVHTYHYGDVILTPNPSPTTPISTHSGTLYEFSNWSLVENGVITDKKMGTQVPVVTGNLIFAATFNSNDPVDGNIKIFDNIGQLVKVGKSTAPSYQSKSNSANVYCFWDSDQSGWYSGPHDGHGPSSDANPHKNEDVNGKDGGISPTETIRTNKVSGAIQRNSITVTEGGTTSTYYGYIGDSIIYENFSITDTNYVGSDPNNHITFKTEGQTLTSSDLIDEITFVDTHGNITLHIKSLSDWVKFVIIDETGNSTSSTFIDMEQYAQGQEVSVIVPNIPLLAEIRYYIKDNPAIDGSETSAARCGKVEVWTPLGGDCSYVLTPSGTPFDNTNNKYMTHGFVYLYQLGVGYTEKPQA